MVFFFLQFCDAAEVAIIHKKWFSQIWLHTRYDSTKKTRILLYSWLSAITYHKNLAIWGKKNSSKSGKFAAFVVWLCQTDSHAGKGFYSKTSSIEWHFFKGIFHQHIAHHFSDKDQYKFARQAQEKWSWLIILSLYTKVDKKPPHNLTLTFDWSMWFAISRFWLLMVSISCRYEYHSRYKIWSKIMEYINLHGNVSIILTCYA